MFKNLSMIKNFTLPKLFTCSRNVNYPTLSGMCFFEADLHTAIASEALRFIHTQIKYNMHHCSVLQWIFHDNFFYLTVQQLQCFSLFLWMALIKATRRLSLIKRFYSSVARTNRMVDSLSPKFLENKPPKKYYLNGYGKMNQFKQQSQIIKKFDSSQKLIEYVRSSSMPQNTFLYSIAIQQSCQLKDYDCAIQIIELMYHHNITRTVITYNNLFTGLVKSEYGVSECFKYLEKMTQNDGISPNSIICGTLSRGIRIEHNEMDIDMKKVKIIEHLLATYGIKPDVLCYSELVRIFVKSYKIKKAYSHWKGLFDAYTLSLDHNYNDLDKKSFFKPFMAATTDLMNAFASNAQSKDIKKLFKIWKLLKKSLKVDGDRIIYGLLMKGLLNEYEFVEDKDSKKEQNLTMILRLWKEMVDRREIAPDYKNFHCLTRCYLKIIEDGKDESMNKMCLDKLMNDIPRERVKYGLQPIDHVLARYQFQAHLLLFYEDESERVAVDRLFEKYENENKIGISVMVQSEEMAMIDLNDCEYQKEVDFFLRYLLRNYEHMMKGKGLLIMIGKMSDDRSSIQNRYQIEKEKSSEKLKKYIDDTLHAIDCDLRTFHTSEHIVKINKDDIEKLMNHLKNKMTFDN